MIIKELIIENFLCYYGKKKFQFDKGLNVIIGNNGSGKTSFYESIEWLFNGSSKRELPNKKAIFELGEGDSCVVSVKMVVVQFGSKKSLTRSFKVEKVDGDSELSNDLLIAVEQNARGERTNVDAERLSNQIFDARIRKYSMFKGEEELNVLTNPESLDILVNYFSDADHYKKYLSAVDLIAKKAVKAVDDDAKKNKKNSKALENLDYELKILKNKKLDYAKLLKERQVNLTSVTAKLKEVENYIDNAEKLDVYNKKIEKLEGFITRLENNVSKHEKYTESHFDKKWILMHFEKIHNEFLSKVTSWNKERRRLQREHDREIGEKRGLLEASKNILGFLPLPIGTPSRAHMEEMLRDEICKVCNSAAPEGSAPFNFMKKRLEEFIQSQEPEEAEGVEIFPNNYLRGLEILGSQYDNRLAEIRGIYGEINEVREAIEEYNKNLAKHRIEVQEQRESRSRLLGGSRVAEEELKDILSNYNEYQDEKLENSQRVGEYERELKDLQGKIDEKESEKEGIQKETTDKFLLNTKNIAKDIQLIFNESYEDVYNEFIEELEQSSDKLFKETNEGSFTGRISFQSAIGEGRGIDVGVVDKDGNRMKLNKAQENMRDISVLLAISALAIENGADSVPIIMDAPTSSFDAEKLSNFYSAMVEKVGQSIIVTKDFLNSDMSLMETSLRDLGYSTLHQIRIADGYENERQDTVETLIEKY